MKNDLTSELLRWSLCGIIAFAVSTYTLSWRLQPARNVSVLASGVFPQAICRADRKKLTDALSQEARATEDREPSDWLHFLSSLYRSEIRTDADTVPIFIDAISTANLRKLRESALVGNDCKKTSPPTLDNTVIRVEALVRVGIQHFYAVHRECNLMVGDDRAMPRWSVPVRIVDDAKSPSHELLVTDRSRHVELRFDSAVSGKALEESLTDLVLAIRGKPYSAKVECRAMRVDREQFEGVSSRFPQRFDEKNRLIATAPDPAGRLGLAGL
jgi:hypothetical protein